MVHAARGAIELCKRLYRKYSTDAVPRLRGGGNRY